MAACRGAGGRDGGSTQGPIQAGPSSHGGGSQVWGVCRGLGDRHQKADARLWRRPRGQSSACWVCSALTCCYYLHQHADLCAVSDCIISVLDPSVISVLYLFCCDESQQVVALGVTWLTSGLRTQTHVLSNIRTVDQHCALIESY